jgi:hypothetical protein
MIEPAEVDVACRVPDWLAYAWDGFLGLLALRWTIAPGVPAPFSSRFAAAWVGVSCFEAHEAVRELAARGFLRPCGRDPSGCPLWLPAEIQLSKEEQ